MPKKDQTPNAKVFNIVLPNELVERVDKISKDEYRNRSETIREALRSYIDSRSEGRQLHGKALQAREVAKDLLKSLQLSDDAMLAYIQEKDKQGLSELLADRSITFRHLYFKNNDKDLLFIAKAELEAAVAISKNSGNKDATTLPLYNLGKVFEALEDYSQAIKNYKEAIETIHIDPNIKELDPTNPAQNRPSALADMKMHLAYADYKNGDKSAKERLEQALKELNQTDESDDMAKKTWLSGGYMMLAEALGTDQPEEAKKYLDQAKQIIDSDEKLASRKEQWEKLAKEFK